MIWNINDLNSYQWFGLPDFFFNRRLNLCVSLCSILQFSELHNYSVTSLSFLVSFFFNFPHELPQFLKSKATKNTSSPQISIFTFPNSYAFQMSFENLKTNFSTILFHRHHSDSCNKYSPSIFINFRLRYR